MQQGREFRFRDYAERPGLRPHDSTLAGAGILRHVVLSAIAVRRKLRWSEYGSVCQWGGHHVPDDIIRRRFHASWHNFHNLYRDLRLIIRRLERFQRGHPMIEEQREAYDDDRLSPNAESEGFVWRSSTGKVDPWHRSSHCAAPP